MPVEPEKRRPIHKFRCYQCQGMLGVSKAKSGATMRCPKCGAELIVPDFDEDLKNPGVDIEEESALRRLGTLIGVDRRASPVIPGEFSVGSKPTEFAPDVSFADVSVFTGESPASRTPVKIPPADLGVDPPFSEGEEDVPSSIEVETPKAIMPTSGRGRSRDVSIPRNVLAAWSFLAILAAGFAFTAGLLIGHYVWKGR